MERLGTKLSSDVLIIGHGIAGVSAGISIKESNPKLDVLLVDKASAGWSGKANKGGCIFLDIAPGATPEDTVKFHVENTGEYLNNQEAFLRFIANTPKVLDKLQAWGVPLNRDRSHLAPYEGGAIPSPWTLVSVERDFLQRMTNHAKKIGCRFMDKVTVTDLLTDGNQVAGAVGFSLLDGEKFIFQSTAVVLANGNQDYRAMTMWNCARGDGIAAAWRAGVEMRNGEFGTFRQCGAVDMAVWEIASSEDNLYNAKGEYISPKYRPWLADPEFRAKIKNTMIYDSNSQSYSGLYKEILAGNGPIYVNLNEYDRSQITKGRGRQDMPRPKWTLFREINAQAKETGIISTRDGMTPITASLVGEQSPIKVGLDMATSMEGLWAVGDTCYNGSGISGAVPAPPGRLRGSGLAFAVYSSLAATPGVLAYMESAKSGQIDKGQAEKLLDDVFAPLHRSIGVDPMEIVRNIRRLMARVEYSTYMRQDRLEEGLEYVLHEKEKLDRLTAKDYHYLSTANEARSFVISAEIHFRTAPLRKESRGWFMREDYPARDDENWLKYINFKNDNGNFKIWYEDVPIEKYPFKPSTIK